MIRFFRTLRQKLLAKNQVRRYLLYAVGEILLVVIGILIALQIDNYNTRNQERKSYYSYLLRLKEDMASLKEEITWRKELESRLIDLGQYELDVLTGKEKNPDPLKLALSIEYTGNINRYELTSPTYLELNSTGNLSLIENDSLMKYLSGYYLYILKRKDQKSEWEPWIKEYRSLVRNILDQEDRAYIDLRFSLKNSDANSPAWKDFTLKTQKEHMVRELLKIPNLKGLLQDVISGRKVTLIYQNIEVETSDRIIRLIESEITRLEEVL